MMEGTILAWTGEHYSTSILKAMSWSRSSRPFLSTPSRAYLRREVVPPAEWLGDRGISQDWLLLAGTATHNTFAYVWQAPLVKYRVRWSSLLRNVASENGEPFRSQSRLREMGALEPKEVLP